jgi:succinate dehydrogenase / fumarate reductase, cytochrome b subunit
VREPPRDPLLLLFCRFFAVASRSDRLNLPGSPHCKPHAERNHVMPLTRPKHLNLMEIRLPLPAFVSILHRVSGAILFLMLPLLLCLLGSSLESPRSFQVFKEYIGNPMVKVVLLGLLWAYLHHFCAGIRHLALDLHMGLELATARTTSYVVLAVSLILTAAIGVKLW